MRVKKKEIISNKKVLTIKRKMELWEEEDVMESKMEISR